MTAAWITLVLMTVARLATGTLQVAIIAPRNVTDSLVRRICVEANAIWQSGGVVFECPRIRPEEANVFPLTVTIDEREVRRGPDGALGWILFTSDGPGRSIFLSRASAEELVRHTPGFSDITVASHEMLVGRALGRALAHEVGHYLLRSKVHTLRGLMRAALSGAEFLALSRDGFALTVDQWSAVARSLQAIGLPSHVQDRVAERHLVEW